jgi:hypothetical protein
MTTPQPPTLFDEILDFLASIPTADQIVAFEPPTALQERLSYLLEQNRQDTISADERAELEEFLRMNRFMSRLKLRVNQKATH